MERLRVCFVIYGMDSIYTQEVSSPEEAELAVNSIAGFLNYHIDHKTGLVPDHCNGVFLERYNEESKEWEEWTDEEGREFDVWEEEVYNNKEE